MKKIINILNEDETEWLYVPNVVYHKYGNLERHLQMIIPFRRQWEDDKKFPLILFIPGSAWHKQEMHNNVPDYAKLAELGFVVAAMEYRESDLERFPAQVEDVGNALDFLPTLAEQFHIDMDKIFLAGNSSGAHIAMMATLLDCHHLCRKLPNIRGVIGLCGSYDILICADEPLPPWMKVRPSTVLLGVNQIEGNEEVARKASCVTYVTEDVSLPPILLMHSQDDPVVSVDNTRKLYERLIQTQHPVTYYELEGDAHCGYTYWSIPVLSKIAEFISSV